MMDFDTEGYLSLQMDNFINDITYKNKEIFNLCEDLNRYAQTLKFDIHTDKSKLSQVLIVGLFVKILNSYQAAIILSRYGLCSQANSINRVSLEALFVLRAIESDNSLAKVLIGEDSKNMEKILRKVTSNKDSVFDNIQSEVDVSDLEPLVQKNKDEDNNILKVEKWAELSGLTNLYLTMYSELSNDVHVEIRNLSQYLTTDSSGIINGISDLPDTTNIPIILLDSLVILSSALESIHTVFSIGNFTIFKDIEMQILKLCKARNCEQTFPSLSN